MASMALVLENLPKLERQKAEYILLEWICINP